MKKSVFICLLVFAFAGPGLFFSSQAAAGIEDLPPEPSDIPTVTVDIDEITLPENKEIILDVYDVKPGDYLAAIAEREYGDKDLWKIIHRYNTYIKDPHWIFPYDKIILPVIVDKLPEIPEIPKEKPKIEPKKEIREYGHFVAPDDFEFAGTIVEFKEEKAMHIQGEYVFIDLGKKDKITPNQKMGIYRMNRYVVHPVTGELLGNMVENIGEIMIMNDIEEEAATAKIVYCDRPIELGDMLLPKK
ncbi:MAG: hypothetical protein ABIH89_03360 [Elusimicrobiota bacterium]